MAVWMGRLARGGFLRTRQVFDCQWHCAVWPRCNPAARKRWALWHTRWTWISVRWGIRRGICRWAFDAGVRVGL